MRSPQCSQRSQALSRTPAGRTRSSTRYACSRGMTCGMEHVPSRDGTSIGYAVSGSGPPLVLVHGTTGAHWSFALLAPHLEDRFTVCAVDRRGRGGSGDTTEYSIEREFEDVAAVVDALPEPAGVFGHSYGATVALGAARLGAEPGKLVLYEPSPGHRRPGRGGRRLESLVAEGTAKRR